MIAAVSAAALMINGCGGTAQSTTTAAETTAAETAAAETTTAAETTKAPETTTAAETTPEETKPKEITFYRTSEAANVRKEPSADAELITTLPEGYELNVPEGLGESWTKIILGSDEAYISSKLIKVSTVGVAQDDQEEETGESVEAEEETLEDGEIIDNEEEEDSGEEENPEEDLPDEKTGVYIGPGTYTPPAGYGGSSGGSGSSSGSQVTQGPQAPAPDLSDVPDDGEDLGLAPDEEDGNEEPNPSGNVKKTKKNSSGGMQKPESGPGQGAPAAP